MALSSSDVHFLNEMMERHLARQRNWPWVRFVLLLCGVMLVGFGVWLWSVTPVLEDGMSESGGIKGAHHSMPASTEPVTEGQLLTMLQSSDRKAEMEARFAATIATTRLMCFSSALVQFFIGCSLIAHTLARWNVHRRDAILIGLLREKCREEFEVRE